jgi:hypothetical protein
MGKLANSHRNSTALARSLALGHHIEDAFMKGKLRSHAEAADTLRISKARVSQLVALTFLAPDIQEEILLLDLGDPVAQMSERVVVELIARHRAWIDQRGRWAVLKEIVPTPGRATCPLLDRTAPRRA